jgi:hypothetical protein
MIAGDGRFDSAAAIATPGVFLNAGRLLPTARRQKPGIEENAGLRWKFPGTNSLRPLYNRLAESIA